MHHRTAKYVPATLALIAGMVGLQGCKSTGWTEPIYDDLLRDYEWGRAELAQQAQSAGKAELLKPSGGLIEAELQHHLPPSARDGSSRQRLYFKRRGGALFGDDTCEVIALGDFTPERVKKFADAARRLQGHLKPAPKFRLHLFNDAAAKPTLVRVIELDRPSQVSLPNPNVPDPSNSPTLTGRYPLQ